MANITSYITLVDESTTAADARGRVNGADAYQACNKISDHFMSLAGKNPRRGSFTVRTYNGDGVAASGTVTCASVSAADTVTVGNIVFTAVSGTPSGNQFKRGVSDTADGLSLATAINAQVNSSINALLTASNNAGVVTITCLATGSQGNAIQLSSSNNTRLAVVAMASGANDTSTATSYSCGI